MHDGWVVDNVVRGIDRHEAHLMGKSLTVAEWEWRADQQYYRRCGSYRWKRWFVVNVLQDGTWQFVEQAWSIKQGLWAIKLAEKFFARHGLKCNRIVVEEKITGFMTQYFPVDTTNFSLTW